MLLCIIFFEVTTAKEPVIQISLAEKRQWELEIKILREAPSDEKATTEFETKTKRV
jgi:hypothetical protein